MRRSENWSRVCELQLYDNTLIVIASDHGQSLGAHGEETHGVFLYGRPVGRGSVLIYQVGRVPSAGSPAQRFAIRQSLLCRGPEARRAYAQLEALEPEMRESGIVYKCLPGQHDDLGISCAMLNWAAHHPHLDCWMGNMAAARRPRRRPQPKISWAAWS